MRLTFCEPLTLAPSLLTLSTRLRTVLRPDTMSSQREEQEAGASFRRLSALSRPESEAFNAY